MKDCTVKKIFGGPCVGSGHRCARVPLLHPWKPAEKAGVVSQMQRARYVDTRYAKEALTVHALRAHGMRNEMYTRLKWLQAVFRAVVFFYEDGAFPPCRQQANAVTRMASEAVLHYMDCLLQPRCASRGQGIGMVSASKSLGSTPTLSRSSG